MLDTDYIIHLAGAGVADENWSEHRKQEILESRLLSTKLLYQAVEKATVRPKVIIAAAAIGYYGADTGNICLDESSPLGDGFLADVCRQWEIEIKKFENLGVRTVILRLGIVLSEKGGAYEKMILPIKIGMGAALGTGKQIISWIHIDDLVNMILYSLQNDRIEGIFNAVAPNPVNNEDFNRIASKVLHRPFWLPNVPSFLLELILGERSSIILGGNKVSAKKIKDAGFRFQFEELDTAIKNLSTK